MGDISQPRIRVHQPDTIRSDTGPYGMVPRWVIQKLAGDCTAVAVYAALSTYAAAGRGAFPGQDTLSELLGVSLTTVNRGIARLKRAGLLRTSPRLVQGRKIGNEYELTMIPGMGADAYSVVSTDEALTPIPQLGADAYLYEQTNEQTRVTRGRSPQSGITNGTADALRDFDAWWTEYPRRTDKARAREKYLARRRSGATAEDLLTAARQYARERDGEPDKFTKHAATFLAPDGPWTEALDRSRRRSPEVDDDGRPDLTAIQARLNAEQDAWDALTEDEQEAERMKDPRYRAMIDGSW